MRDLSRESSYPPAVRDALERWLTALRLRPRQTWRSPRRWDVVYKSIEADLEAGRADQVASEFLALAATAEDEARRRRSDRRLGAAKRLWDRQAAEIDLEAPRRRWPRLYQGKDVWLWHGTSTELLPEIREYGLLAEPPKPTHPSSTPGYVYLTTISGGWSRTGGDALFYARSAASKHGGDPVLLRVIVPWDELEPDADDEDIESGNWQFRTPHDVPADMVREIGEERVGWPERWPKYRNSDEDRRRRARLKATGSVPGGKIYVSFRGRVGWIVPGSRAQMGMHGPANVTVRFSDRPWDFITVGEEELRPSAGPAPGERINPPRTEILDTQHGPAEFEELSDGSVRIRRPGCESIYRRSYKGGYWYEAWSTCSGPSKLAHIVFDWMQGRPVRNPPPHGVVLTKAQDGIGVHLVDTKAMRQIADDGTFLKKTCPAGLGFAVVDGNTVRRHVAREGWLDHLRRVIGHVVTGELAALGSELQAGEAAIEGAAETLGVSAEEVAGVLLEDAEAWADWAALTAV